MTNLEMLSKLEDALNCVDSVMMDSSITYESRIFGCLQIVCSGLDSTIRFIDSNLSPAERESRAIKVESDSLKK